MVYYILDSSRNDYFPNYCGVIMKYCGCNSCRNSGERNLYEDFELYYSTRELETKAAFEDIFKSSYSIGEMEKLYAELEPEFSGESRVAARIKSYSMFDASENTLNAVKYLRGEYGGYEL